MGSNPNEPGGFYVGDLVTVDDRQGRVVKDCGSFVVVTVGDPDRVFIRMCPLVAVPSEAVTRVG